MTIDKITQLAKSAGKVAEDKKAEDIVVMDLRGKSSLADFFVICSVTNTRHSRALAQAIEEGLAGLGEKMDHIEGYTEGTWILMDYIDLIIHIFTKETREYYDLEHLWGDAPKVDINE